MIFNLINKAKHIFFNNLNTGLKATNVEDALYELNGTLGKTFISRDTETVEPDANLYVKSGIYRIGEIANAQYKNGLLLVFAHTPNEILQINTLWSPEYVAVRIYWWGTWHGWYKVQTEKIT